MIIFNKKILNFAVIITLTFISIWWTSFVFHLTFNLELFLAIVFLRIIASLIILKDFSISWSKATQKTFLIKGLVGVVPFLIYTPFYYGEVRLAFLLSELSFYILAINFLMYSYYYIINRSGVKKTKSVVIYGAGELVLS